MNKEDNNIESVILDDLLLDINDGRYRANDKLPSSNELAQKYNVSRIKVRKVYDKLESMGYVYSFQGRGCYLKERGEHINLVLSGKESFTKKMIEKGYNLKSKVIFCERIPYNNHIYSELNAERDDEVYRIGRLRIINNEPIAIHISYLNKRIFPNIFEDGKYIISIFDYYKKNGFKNYSSKRSILSIVYPTLRERRYLECEELVPVMKLESNCIDEESRIILEYTEIIYRGDKFKYEIV